MPPLVQNSKLLLIYTRHGFKTCTKFGIDQVKGSKYIERTTDWARKSGLTLTFEHVTWKSIKDHLHIQVNPCIDQVKGQKISSGQHLVYRPTDRLTQLQNNMPPFSRGGGHKNLEKLCTQAPHWLLRLCDRHNVVQNQVSSGWTTAALNINLKKSTKRFFLLLRHIRSLGCSQTVSSSQVQFIYSRRRKNLRFIL